MFGLTLLAPLIPPSKLRFDSPQGAPSSILPFQYLDTTAGLPWSAWGGLSHLAIFGLQAGSPLGLAVYLSLNRLCYGHSPLTSFSVHRQFRLNVLNSWYLILSGKITVLKTNIRPTKIYFQTLVRVQRSFNLMTVIWPCFQVHRSHNIHNVILQFSAV